MDWKHGLGPLLLAHGAEVELFTQKDQPQSYLGGPLLGLCSCLQIQSHLPSVMECLTKISEVLKNPPNNDSTDFFVTVCPPPILTYRLHSINFFSLETLIFASFQIDGFIHTKKHHWSPLKTKQTTTEHLAAASSGGLSNLLPRL